MKKTKDKKERRKRKPTDRRGIAPKSKGRVQGSVFLSMASYSRRGTANYFLELLEGKLLQYSESGGGDGLQSWLDLKSEMVGRLSRVLNSDAPNVLDRLKRMLSNAYEVDFVPGRVVASAIDVYLRTGKLVDVMTKG